MGWPVKAREVQIAWTTLEAPDGNARDPHASDSPVCKC
jgi:hypothetical protein